MNKERFTYLYRKYQQKELTAEEREEWTTLLADPNLRQPFEEILDSDWEEMADVEWLQMKNDHSDSILDHILLQPQQQSAKIFTWPRIAAAASIILCLSVGGYFLTHHEKSAALATVKIPDVNPAVNSAVLTIANGKKIILKENNSGRIAQEGGMNVNQKAGGQLSYQPDQTANTAEPVQHTLSTLRGDKYQLTLADGTEAYLDAASSITYPVAFTGKERKVTVTGQVYFKIKHNAAQPFKVIAGNQEIEDIGTEFNVNAYNDEPVLKTTLITGAVKVNYNEHSAILKPGEQVLIKGEQFKIATANIEETTAWLQGKMILHKETLKSILRKVSRIYDVNIVWQDDMRKELFGGAVSRTKKLSNVLDYFRVTGNVDFKIEGKTVTVFRKKKQTPNK